MNLVAIAPNGDWYLVVVMPGEYGSWITRAKCLHPTGMIRVVGGEFTFSERNEAERKARELIKTKVKKAKYVQASIGDLPNNAASHLVADAEKWISPEEMMEMIRRSRHERYVIFSDLTGLEDRFDAGLEYIGIMENDEYVSVYDREGQICECAVSRFSSIRPTEEALEAGLGKVSRSQVPPPPSVSTSRQLKKGQQFLEGDGGGIEDCRRCLPLVG